MTHSHSHSLERHCDVAVVGGSAAGLAAALQLGRQRRSVIVIDAGEPRNAPASAMHGYLGRDGSPPAELLASGREEVRGYGVEVLSGQVLAVTATTSGFLLQLSGGHTVRARKVLAATGIVDEVPEVEGLAPRWGKDVIHCPFCHGYEVRDTEIVHLVTDPATLHPAPLFRQLSRRYTIVLQGGTNPEDPALAPLLAAGVRVRAVPAVRVLSDPDGALRGVELADGEIQPAEVIAVATRFRPRTAPFEPLGLTTTPHLSGLGAIVDVDPLGQTAIPGLFAAGNLTDPGQQVAQAAAHGSRVGAMIAMALATEDLVADRPAANQSDWDQRYSGEALWSGRPNASLVAEFGGTAASGSALDVGAGEGGDAVWLAERGWDVTASDVSQRALLRIAAAATERGVEVQCLQADANAPDPFQGRVFDLVSAHYASIPRTADGRGIRALLAAVAPGGTLLVVGHDLAPMRIPVDPTQQTRPFDPDAYVHTEHVAAALADSPEWIIETYQTRTRPPGAASQEHHVDDVILRARRR